VGDVPVYGDLLLSPMDGFSDLPFRSICRKLGSAMSYTEFINALDVLNGHPRLEDKLAFLPEERPVVFQIFDNQPERLLEAALVLQERQPDVIDINMGCSARSVSGRGAGAGLLREPGKIARIFSLLSRALEVPISGKIRLGWDDTSRNYLEVARAVEENGGALLAVHARTRQQGYGGQADWEAIAEIKQALSIPVIGNGDVRSPKDILSLKALSGCDGVMIGRGAVGNPWIFTRLPRQAVLPGQVRLVILDHLDRMMSVYGEARGLMLFRKHARLYLKPYALDRETLQELLTTTDSQAFKQIIHRIL
jgi:tRNA-dihydrouridine synthase B